MCPPGQNGTRTGHFKIQSKYKGWVKLRHAVR